MTPQNNRFFLNRVIVFESAANFILVLFIWLDEINEYTINCSSISIIEVTVKI